MSDFSKFWYLQYSFLLRFEQLLLLTVLIRNLYKKKLLFEVFSTKIYQFFNILIF